jgi:hypothetical protein
MQQRQVLTRWLTTQTSVGMQRFKSVLRCRRLPVRISDRSYDVEFAHASTPVDCDTGSADFFLPGPSCGYACNGHELYSPNSSSSAEALGRTFTVEYADGSMATGDLYTDTVSLGGFKVR